MRIAIFGAGSVGGYFGGRLAQAGHSVVFIARGEHLAAIRRRGLRVESLAGDFVVHPAEATDAPVSADKVEAMLVCVKAWQVPAAATAMVPMLRPKSIVVPLQNGVEATGQLAAVVGGERVLGGLCKIISHVSAPGHIRHVGVEPRLEFGEWDGRRTERAKGLLAAFEGVSGVAASISEDIQAAVWEKFLFIAPFSGVGAVTRMPAHVFRAVPETRDMLRGAMQEVFDLSRVRHLVLRSDAVDRALEFVDALPDGTTSSMQRDLQEGRPSELEYQNGTVVRLARAAGVPVPVNECIYRSLLPLELGARKTSA